VQEAGARHRRRRAAAIAAAAGLAVGLVPVAALASTPEPPPTEGASAALVIGPMDGPAPLAAAGGRPATRMGVVSTTTPTSSTSTTSTVPPSTVVAKGTMLFPMDPEPRCDILDSFGDARGGRAHQGVDILATLGQEVYAVADGTLTSQFLDGDDDLAGNGWRLSLPDRTFYHYFHLSAFAPGLARGSVVRRGDLIGYVGDTGNPGPGNYHLHFEYHPRGGAAVDPLDYLDVPSTCTIT
jgi:peptidoglycan LD-endopeptidase LytH